ncbi:cutinase family protein [Corynebacterium aquatimens]|uniref:Cutinase n=1 Tax=Corynebacterium aquatimens TaxID=1190508 RepID=A0A931GT38_9CORY|nr:cutinase family protein [Corynebacterium aquatimens]MBG6121470.1 hypothetical protein [Corynebacterium aquatimens]WJY65986.1 Cutinase [Corynebacterium aquatimens]
MWKKFAAAALTIAMTFMGVAHADAQPRSFGQRSGCASEYLIAIPGGGNTLPGLPSEAPVGDKVYHVSTGVRARSGGTIKTVRIAYAAVPFAVLSYTDSERSGYDETNRTISRLAHQCPEANFSITGFSEGAGIGAKIINDIAYGRGPIPAQRFSSAALISNPRLGDNGGAFGGGAYEVHKGALEALPGGYGKVGSRVLDICRVDDPICALPEELRSGVDPMLRVAVFRGQLPVMEILAATGVPVILTFLFGFGNHGKYGPDSYNQASQWIVDRSRR